MKDVKNIVIASLVIVVIILLGFNRCEKQKYNELSKLANSLGDSLEIKRNKDSSQTAKISLLQVQSANAFLALENLEGINKELQQELKKEKGKLKDGGSITIINSGTTYSGSATSTTIPFGNSDCDSVIIGQNKDTTWIKWKVRTTKQTTTLDLKTKDKFKVVIGSEKAGLFKKREPYVEVTSSSPFSDIKSMRAVEVKDTRKPFISFGIQIGYGIVKSGLSPYIGIGANLNLFTIWR